MSECAEAKPEKESSDKALGKSLLKGLPQRARKKKDGGKKGQCLPREQRRRIQTEMKRGGKSKVNQGRRDERKKSNGGGGKRTIGGTGERRACLPG